MTRTPDTNRLIVPLALLLCAPLVFSDGFAADDGESSLEASGKNNFCTLTLHRAYNACWLETGDDFYIQRAVCLNTEDDEERDECYDEAREDRVDAQLECRDQRLARREVCEMLGEDRYDPEYEPSDFVDPLSIGYEAGDVAPNPWFPLVPGTRWVYESEDEVITVEVLDETYEIEGVTCIVVRDLVVEKGGDELEADEGEGDPIEDTLDWYAQDMDGNVWYFGEIAVNYEDGQITDIDGSWKTGEEGARPGILMPADPMVGDVYRQEWLLGDAEDMAEVQSLAAEPELGDDNVGDCSVGCLQTLEWTPLEADSFEFKYYQAGVGMVQEADPEDPESTVELIEFDSPAD